MNLNKRHKLILSNKHGLHVTAVEADNSKTVIYMCFGMNSEDGVSGIILFWKVSGTSTDIGDIRDKKYIRKLYVS